MKPDMRGPIPSLAVAAALWVAGCDDRCVRCSPAEPSEPECTYTVAPTSQRFGHEGGTGTVTVTTRRSCAWTGTSNVPWIGIASISAETVAYVVHVNGGASRSGTLTVANRLVTVTQDAAPVAPPPPPPPPPPQPVCTYAVQETPQVFTYQGGNGGFSVSASRSDCPWTAVSNVVWVAVTGGSPGTGNGSVTYLVAGNGGPARTGTISVAGKTVTVKQSAP